MKKLLLVLALTTATAKAGTDFHDTWKKVNSYRAVSAAKAVFMLAAVSAMTGGAIAVARHDNDGFLDSVKNGEGKKAFVCGSIIAGLVYAGFHILRDHFWPNVKHAVHA